MIKLKNRPYSSTVYSLIEHANVAINIRKFEAEIRTAAKWFFRTFFDAISKFCQVYSDLGKMRSICILLIETFSLHYFPSSFSKIAD